MRFLTSEMDDPVDPGMESGIVNSGESLQRIDDSVTDKKDVVDTSVTDEKEIDSAGIDSKSEHKSTTYEKCIDTSATMKKVVDTRAESVDSSKTNEKMKRTIDLTSELKRAPPKSFKTMDPDSVWANNNKSNTAKNDSKDITNDIGNIGSSKGAMHESLVSNEDNVNCGDGDTGFLEIHRRNGDNNTPTAKGYASNNGSASDKSVKQDIMEDTLEKIRLLENAIHEVEDIPDFLFHVPLQCLSVKTLENLKYRLDPQEEVVMTDSGYCKDFRGVAEFAQLCAAYIRYITTVDCSNRISDVISMWIKEESDGPKATVGNLRTCLRKIDRGDVLTDLSVSIVRDALRWKHTELEANTTVPKQKDTSWQLTRHDVISGKETNYTACLMFADEDYGMAKIIIKLYKSVNPSTLFFLPQFDLKAGKYELDATADVISKRCGNKVIFLLSEYFFASDVCQFAVNYTASNGIGKGNIIPFHLTKDVDHVPNVLKGIAGIRWFRKGTRKYTWQLLTDCILSDTVKEDQLQKIKDAITDLVDHDEKFYLSDPPYDTDVKPAGEPIVIKYPESTDLSAPSEELFKAAEVMNPVDAPLSKQQNLLIRKLSQVGNKIKSLVFGESTSKNSLTSSSRAQPTKQTTGASCSADTGGCAPRQNIEMQLMSENASAGGMKHSNTAQNEAKQCATGAKTGCVSNITPYSNSSNKVVATSEEDTLRSDDYKTYMKEDLDKDKANVSTVRSGTVRSEGYFDDLNKNLIVDSIRESLEDFRTANDSIENDDGVQVNNYMYHVNVDEETEKLLYTREAAVNEDHKMKAIQGSKDSLETHPLM